jgi:Patatin-like phospholipase
MIRRILSIDGGGIKGVFPASFLATVEQSLGQPISAFFDLIAGTSTGGIIALGLGLGITAQKLLTFYITEGPAIFQGNGRNRLIRWLFRSKYDSAELKSALERVFQARKLGHSRKRLVIPSLNIETGEVHIWKTAHAERFERDYGHSAVEVALSTSAAPTYFPIYESESGAPLVDGGMFANNPLAIAVVEAVGVLGWDPEELRILSLGCTAEPMNVKLAGRPSMGISGWATTLVDVFMRAQSHCAIGMVQHLVPNRNNIVRVSPSIANGKFSLDSTQGISRLKGLGDSEARKALPFLRTMFFGSTVQEYFVPFHVLESTL